MGLFFVTAFFFSMKHFNKGSDNVLANLDRSDLIRMEKFVSKFNEGKLDYLIAVSPTIEGSFVIYDFISTGNEVKISIDPSRDPFSGDKTTKTYECKGISIRNSVNMEGIRSVVEIRDCTGDQTVKKAGILTFTY